MTLKESKEGQGCVGISTIPVLHILVGGVAGQDASSTAVIKSHLACRTGTARDFDYILQQGGRASRMMSRDCSLHQQFSQDVVTCDPWHPMLTCIRVVRYMYHHVQQHKRDNQAPARVAVKVSRPFSRTPKTESYNDVLTQHEDDDAQWRPYNSPGIGQKAAVTPATMLVHSLEYNDTLALMLEGAEAHQNAALESVWTLANVTPPSSSRRAMQ